LPCSRCKAGDRSACAYDINLRTAKEVLKAEIDRLKTRNAVSDHILQALVGDDDLASSIISQLKAGHSLESISKSIGNPSASASRSDSEEVRTRHTGSKAQFSPIERSVSSQALVTPQRSGKQLEVVHVDEVAHGSSSMRSSQQWPENTGPEGGIHIMSELTIQSGGKERIDHIRHAGVVVPGEPWTRVTANNAFIHHLMSLYFCWEYPTFATLSKEQFLDDYLYGRRRYCSSLLVNSMLALASRFSDQPEARADRNNSETVGDHFFKEAKRLLALEKLPSLTTIQALGLMSLREASCGRENMSMSYSYLSMEMTKKLELHLIEEGNNSPKFSREELEVRSATAWGSFTLEKYI
jgi:Fungal specific transcription factor domain